MEIHARYNANGNSRDEFQFAHRNLSVADNCIEIAMGIVVENVLHGRNYQHKMEPSTWALRDRVLIDGKIEKARRAIRDVQDAIEHAILGGDND